MEKYFKHQDSASSGLGILPSVQSRQWTQYLAAGLATLSALAIGTHLSWSSSATLLLHKEDSEIPITEEQGSWIGSLITLGALMGAFPAGAIATQIGPKRTLQLITFPLFMSWYIIAYSGCVWGLYTARFLAGFGIGAACVAAPMYISELAEPKIRGTLGTFFQLQITIGLLLGYILGGTIDNFQLLALISSAVPIVFLFTFSFMPESPVFLCSKGQINEAKKSLEFLRGKNYNVEDELVKIADTVKDATSNKGSISDLLKCKATMKALVVSLALMFFQQMSGINAVLFNAEPIFKQSGSTMPSSICAIVVGAVQVMATYLSTLLIDRLGRKILLIISSSVMAICLTILGVYFHLQLLECDLSSFSFLPLVCVATFLIVFSIGFGPIPWMMMGELFSPNVKGAACSTSAAFNWLLAFTVTKVFQPLNDGLGLGLTFGIFAIISAIGTVFTILMVPETKDKNLQEVQNLLVGKDSKSKDFSEKSVEIKIKS